VSGQYRGERFYEDEDIGRVFLDTVDGPVPWREQRHGHHVGAFQLAEGDSIIIFRTSEDTYRVVREGD
jgi:hypothetical protein